MGYQPSGSTILPRYPASDSIQSLQNQKELLEAQIQNLQDSLERIEKRLTEIEKHD